MKETEFSEIKRRILPYFVEVYGEAFREIIKQQLDRIVPIFYTTLKSQEYRMRELQREKKINMTFQFLENNQIQLPKELKQNILDYGNVHELKKIEEAKKILDICFGDIQYQEVTIDGLKNMTTRPTDNDFFKNKSINILAKLGISLKQEDFNSWITSEEARPVLKKIESLKNQIQLLDQEYQTFNRQFDSVRTFQTKCDQVKKVCYNF